jgi:hypothetical protein
MTSGHGRRRFLAHLLSLGALGASPPGARAASNPAPDDPVASMLSRLLGHRESAVVVGRAYLRLAPDARDPARLVDLLSASCDGLALDADVDTLRRRLGHRIRRDFTEDRVVDVDGWRLSLTEARLCGLAALLLPR